MFGEPSVMPEIEPQSATSKERELAGVFLLWHQIQHFKIILKKLHSGAQFLIYNNEDNIYRT